MTEIALQTRSITKRYGALTAVDSLSDAVRELLDKAVVRAKDNGRQTVKDRDI